MKFMKSKKVLVTLLSFLCGLPTFAGGLSTPFETENAGVLPPSIRNPRLKSVSTWVENAFTSEGTSVPLAFKLNKDLRWVDVISSQASATQKNLLKGSLISQNIEEQDVVGKTSGAVNAFVNVNVPVLAFGVTERWTMALAIPVYDVQINADTGFVVTPQGQGFLKNLAKSSPVDAASASDKLTNPLASKLQQLGYQPVSSEKFHKMGDAKVVSKYQVFSDDENKVALKTDLTLPTGTAPNPDKLVDFPTGDGQYAVGLGAIWDHHLVSKWQYTLYGLSNLPISNKISKRIPLSQEDPLSSDFENVTRRGGEQFVFGNAIQYGETTNGFYANVGYVYQYMNSIKWSGSFYSSERYGLLNQQTPEQSLTSVVSSIGYSTIQSYRDKSFPVPLQANLTYGHPLSGKNTAAANVYMAELVLFF
jgi:hypothetical protein